MPLQYLWTLNLVHALAELAPPQGVGSTRLVSSSVAEPTSVDKYPPNWESSAMAEPVVQQTEAVTTAATSQSESSSKFIQTALRFAELSKLAYHDYPVVLERLPEYYHLQAEMEICDKHTDTQGFIASDSSSVVVAFRGTDAFIDILLGLKFVPVPIGPGL